MAVNSSLVTFLDDLASERPTPGGGGAAAVSGAIGAALVSMVAKCHSLFVFLCHSLFVLISLRIEGKNIDADVFARYLRVSVHVV